MTFSQCLAKFRIEADMTQENLAEKCHVSRQAIVKWEHGDSIPTLDKLILLADIFNISLDELVGRKPANHYEHFKEFVLKYAADDIPKSEEDNISPIVSRYLKFAVRMGINPHDRLEGLDEIFLNGFLREHDQT